jgi:NCAIR mutase (PurE)-related protein
MTGDKQLVAMRRARRVPRAVWITDSDDTYARETARSWHLHPNTADGSLHAHLRFDAADIPQALDLRCLIGLEVHIACDRGTARAHRVFEAVKSAGAVAVIALINDEVKLHRRQMEETHG